MSRKPQTNSAEDVHIVALGVGFVVANDDAVVAWTPEERGQVVRWMSYCGAAASDHIVRKKNLIQPDFSKGVIRDYVGADDSNAAVQGWQKRVHAMFSPHFEAPH